MRRTHRGCSAGWRRPRAGRRAAARRFLAGWRSTVDERLVPATEAGATGLLALFELQKLLYELRYELAHRPDWVAVPLAGLERSVSAGELARRRRPPPRRRGTPRAALRAARRAPPRRRRRPLRGLGAERALRLRGRRLELLERGRRPARATRRLGDLGGRRRERARGPALQALRRGRRRDHEAEGGPVRDLRRGAAGDRLDRLPEPFRVVGRRVARAPPRRRSARAALLRLRGARRLLAAGALLAGARGAARPVRRRARASRTSS